MQIKFTELTDFQWQIIEKYFVDHNPRKHSIRTILNAILWITRTGSQWRNMESKYPPWQSVYYYFRVWRNSGLLDEILAKLVEHERIRQGRNPRPSAAAVDSQSVKIVAFVNEQTGVDGGKKVNGRKRHLLVDVLGLPLAIHVSAANEHDGQEGFELLVQALKYKDSLQLIRGDKHYGGQFEEAASWCNFEVDTTQRPPTEKGFVPQTGRWPVERSFGWTTFFRRLSRDYEKLPQSSVAFFQIMFVTIILSRLQR